MFAAEYKHEAPASEEYGAALASILASTLTLGVDTDEVCHRKRKGFLTGAASFAKTTIAKTIMVQFIRWRFVLVFSMEALRGKHNIQKLL